MAMAIFVYYSVLRKVREPGVTSPMPSDYLLTLVARHQGYRSNESHIKRAYRRTNSWLMSCTYATVAAVWSDDRQVARHHDRFAAVADRRLGQAG